MSRLVPLLLLLAACEATPAIDVSRFEARAPRPPDGYPSLLPREALEAEPPRPAAPQAGAEVRAAALRARAAALAGPVIEPAERARLEGARP